MGADVWEGWWWASFFEPLDAGDFCVSGTSCWKLGTWAQPGRKELNPTFSAQGGTERAPSSKISWTCHRESPLTSPLPLSEVCPILALITGHLEVTSPVSHLLSGVPPAHPHPHPLPWLPTAQRIQPECFLAWFSRPQTIFLALPPKYPPTIYPSRSLGS